MAQRLRMDERRQQLLRVGFQIFGDVSYDEASIDAIAEMAGVSKGLMYHYFGNKRGYYLAVLQHAADLLQAARAPDRTQTREVQLRQGLAAYFRWSQEHGAAYTVLISGGLGADAEVAELLEASRKLVLDDLLGSLGLDPPPDILLLAARSWLGGVEATAQHWSKYPQVEMEQLVELQYATLMGMLEEAARQLGLPINPAVLMQVPG